MKKRRIISALLAALMVTSSLPVVGSVSAADLPAAQEEFGGNLLEGVTPTDENPGNGTLTNVTENNKYVTLPYF